MIVSMLLKISRYEDLGLVKINNGVGKELANSDCFLRCIRKFKAPAMPIAKAVQNLDILKKRGKMLSNLFFVLPSDASLVPKF